MNTKTSKKAKKTTAKQTKKTSNLKYEVASELGVNLGPDATSRQNGAVGGEITRRLVTKGQTKKTK